jgi:signal transduction histidine kinase
MGATAAVASDAPTHSSQGEPWPIWGAVVGGPAFEPASQPSQPKTPSVATHTNELTVLATVAHELRGPLTALATSSELLAEDFEILDPNQVRGMLSAIHRRTLWLQGLVENLLAAATIREGRLQLHPQALIPTDLLSDVCAVVDPLLRQRGQQLRVREARTLPAVAADSRRIGQVLVNLILNASKFGKPGSAIDITFTRRGNRLRVAVADRGPGVAEDQAQRLFEPYYRSARTTVNVKEGVGLGLSIVKSIVEAHGGNVGVESRRGGGARFWFELPTAAAAG